jgi:Putative Actinobacterial Holin-X, holin superfamily III
MATRDSIRPISSVITEVFSEVAYLLQTEIRLARAEIGEKVGRAANGAALLGAAAILLLAGLFVLLLAAVRWLEVAGLPDQWGFLIVGGAAMAIGVGIALKGITNLKGSALVPERTIEQVRADFSVAKEQVK